MDSRQEMAEINSVISTCLAISCRWREAAKLGIKWTIHVEAALTQPEIHGQNG